MVEPLSTGESNQEPVFARPRSGLRGFSLLALIVGLIFMFLLSISLGSVDIPVADVIAILTGSEPQRATWTAIVLKFRLPKALTAVLAGAALSTAGLMMQTLFRNPLAGPFVLGISSGASLGVALVVLSAGVGGVTLLAGLGAFGSLGIAVAASLGAGLVLSLVVLVSRRVDSTMTLLILGLMFGYATSALVSVLLYFSDAERVQAYISWTFGTFSNVTWSQMRILMPTVLFALILAYFLAKPLNALLLGEAYARSMGLTVDRARFWIIVSSAILGGVITAFCGPIIFLGVAVPHLCRSIFGSSDHRVLLPAVMLLGAILALAADLVAHLPGSQITLPLNAITSLIGAPVVIWVVLSQRNLRRSFAG